MFVIVMVGVVSSISISLNDTINSSDVVIFLKIKNRTFNSISITDTTYLKKNLLIH